MIRLEGLEKSFGGQKLLQKATLVIKPGEKIGLIGANGTGKSTLLRIIAGLEETDAGSVAMPSSWRIGMLRQEPETPAHSLRQEVMGGDPQLLALRQEQEHRHLMMEQEQDPHRHHALVEAWGLADHHLETLGSYTAEARAGALLLGLGFRVADLDRPYREFSGGWRMRVALAKLLFAQPDLLLLDEPTNHLDLESVAWLQQYLNRLEATLVIVSHARDFLNQTAKVIVELEDGTLTRYVGDFDSYLTQKEANLLALEKTAAQQQQRIEALNQFIRRFRAKATKARQVQSRVKQLAKIEPIQTLETSRQAPVIRLPEPPPCAKEMLIIKDAGKSFGEQCVLEKLDLRLWRGERVGLLGPNGAGKTTLLRLLAQETTPDRGEIRLGERVRCAYYAQHLTELLDPSLTVLATVAEQAALGVGEPQLRSLLGGFMFSGDSAFKPVSVLSGGERARLALARMLLSGANLLLLDEPTNHLDMGSRASLEEALEGYTGSFILVSHDRALLEAVCDRFWLVENRRVVPWPDSLEAYLEQVARNRTETPKTDQPAPPANKRQDRQQQEKTIRQLRKRVAQGEEKITALENELKQLEDSLADPGLYQGQANHQRLKDLLQRKQTAEATLTQTSQDWEIAFTELEEALQPE